MQGVRYTIDALFDNCRIGCHFRSVDRKIRLLKLFKNKRENTVFPRRGGYGAVIRRKTIAPGPVRNWAQTGEGAR